MVEVSTLGVILLRGGRGMDSIIGAERCHRIDWLIVFGYLIVNITFFVLSLYVVMSESQLRRECKWVGHKDDVKLDRKLYCLGAILSFFVGFLSVIIGIGGSLLITPVLISMGILPMVISYTSSYLGFLKNVAATVLFLTSGQMPIDYMLFIGFFVVIGVLIAEWRVAQLVQSMGRQSLITFFFTFINLISWALVAYSIYAEFRGFDDFLGFQNYCLN